jgi:hypothetical protein
MKSGGKIRAPTTFQLLRQHHDDDHSPAIPALPVPHRQNGRQRELLDWSENGGAVHCQGRRCFVAIPLYQTFAFYRAVIPRCSKMKRVKLQHEYHDARLTSVSFDGDDVTLIAELDGHWNHQCAERAYLTFRSVKNTTDVRHKLVLSADLMDARLSDEIIGIRKIHKTKYLINLHLGGPLEIECRGLSEI